MLILELKVFYMSTKELLLLEHQPAYWSKMCLLHFGLLFSFLFGVMKTIHTLMLYYVSL